MEKPKIRKASDMKKISLTKEGIYDNLSNQNNTAIYKHAIPPDAYISEDVILEIIKDGFKMYKGNLFGMTDVWIIEW